jgi:hypothetical protein
MIVPDSKPPVLLLGAGALLLTGLVIHTLRRLRRRASSRGARRGSGAGAIVLSTWQPALPEPVASTRFTQGAQNRGRAAKKRP